MTLDDITTQAATVRELCGMCYLERTRLHAMIRRQRSEHGTEIAEIARAAGISRQRVSQIVNGE